MVELLFPSAVVKIKKPEYLPESKPVLKKHLALSKPNAWNVCQSSSMFDDQLSPLLNFIARSSFEMLADQGYDMTNLSTRVSEFWGQEFLKHGQHIEHVHGNGAQVTRFYFVNIPQGCSLPIFFDPRAGKKQINLRQSDESQLTYASEHATFQIEAGDLMLFNSWLPHGFTRHESEEPLQFIHFNVVVDESPPVEII